MRTLLLLLGIAGLAEGFSLATPPPTSAPQVDPNALVVLGYNDLGMHCMNEDFSEICILPPYNTLKATVIRRAEDPRIIKSGAGVTYEIPGNTRSADKTNFWTYAPALFGVNLAPNIGLAGFGMRGVMVAQTDGDWGAIGIPVTPIRDTGKPDSYPLATIRATSGGRAGSTQAVVPVSWEITCNACHNTPGISVATDILRAHDRMHGTTLEAQKPVLCAKCHADPALGTTGVAGVSSMSRAMHNAHDTRMTGMEPVKKCYSCHPGPQTQCLRDVHKTNGMNCISCHGDMNAVANPNRRPWVDEPRCGSCHNVAGHEYEQPGKLYKDSIGHNGVKCIACHGSPHAITPTTNPRDNVQAIMYQGEAGTIRKCTVCHTKVPSDPFNHTRDD